jgi:hypothetical protein
MRIPLFSRISLKLTTVFAVGLFIVQMLEGTDVTFAALTAAFILITTVAFNTTGGFLYPSGWYIFANATLTCIVGLTYKAILGEPGQTHLLTPNRTMLAYCAGMFVTGLVVALVRRLRPRTGLLAGLSVGEGMKKAAMGSLFLGIGLNLVSDSYQAQGSFLAAVQQINYFGILAVLLGTFYQVRKTNGRESTNWIVWVGVGYLVILGGVINFSKEGFLAAPISWLVAAVVAGHNFTRTQILGILVSAFLFQAYLVPYAQVGRIYRPDIPSISGDLQAAEKTLGDWKGTLEIDKDVQSAVLDDKAAPHIYDDHEGFLDRLNMLGPDDALIAYTADGNVEGIEPTYESFLNIIPHFIWKDKPFYYIGNVYAREIGMISPDNESTGVSFSPVGDAYHQAEWLGVFLILPVIIFLLCIVTDSLSGDIREAPWGLIFCVIALHTAPEGMLFGQVHVATYAAFGVVVAALMATYVLPIVTGIITNSERTRVARTNDFRSANLIPTDRGAESI